VMDVARTKRLIEKLEAAERRLDKETMRRTMRQLFEIPIRERQIALHQLQKEGL